jgi:hypothetical protein
MSQDENEYVVNRVKYYVPQVDQWEALEPSENIVIYYGAIDIKLTVLRGEKNV